MTGIACEETPLLGRVAKLERTYIADFPQFIHRLPKLEQVGYRH